MRFLFFGVFFALSFGDRVGAQSPADYSRLHVGQLAIDPTPPNQNADCLQMIRYDWTNEYGDLCLELQVLRETPVWDLEKSPTPPVTLAEAIQIATAEKKQAVVANYSNFKFESVELMFDRVSDIEDDIRWYWLVEFSTVQDDQQQNLSCGFLVLMNRTCISPTVKVKANMPPFPGQASSSDKSQAQDK